MFNSVGALHPRKSGFDLSYNKIFPCDAGQLIPILCDEMIPGDVFKIGADCLVRMMPAVAPVMQEMSVKAEYFFVPYRLLWTDWENFITGGKDGDFESLMPSLRGTIERGSIGDYLGLPLGDISPQSEQDIPVNAWPYLAINFIYNEYYRDENYQPYRPYYVDTHAADEPNVDPFLSRSGAIRSLEVNVGDFPLPRRNWQKDYFTSATFDRQRGPAVALPISGILPVSGAIPIKYTVDGTDVVGEVTRHARPPQASGTTWATPPSFHTIGGNPGFGENAGNIYNDASNLTINLSDAITFNVSDLRLATQIQKWQERNMRAGIRYTEFLHAHFGASPSDSRLDRPEYIGKARFPVIVSEVLQSSATSGVSPQGNMAGHGIGVASNYVGTYRAQEFGVIVGLMSIMPKPTYNSQGVNRQWLRETNKDFYFPEFANLSEQPIYNAEINYHGGDQRGTFGYQGAYDEMRIKHDMVCGLMRAPTAPGEDIGLSFWHLSRVFDANEPVRLNSSFIECNPRKNWLAVPSQPAFVVHYGNAIKAYRPMPEIAEPGLMDHH